MAKKRSKKEPKQTSRSSVSREKSLSQYADKRDFDATPEPRPQRVRKNSSGSFVVQKHDARRLHYDLRLEMDGVLKSWAVPKGFSFNPKDKCLAIQTEDHPLEYGNFEGLIPSGQYGAGVVSLWDRGTYELNATTADGLSSIAGGKLEFVLMGTRLRGEWHMVRLDDGQKNQWLLFKSNDRYARGEGESEVVLNLLNLKPKRFPRRMDMMLARQPRNPLQRLREHSDWLYEPDLPGRRVLIRCRGESVFVSDESGTDVSSQVHSLKRDLRRIRAENVMLDGSLVCLDDQKRPSEKLLMRVLDGTEDRPVAFYARDLLYYENWDLRAFPLIERKAALTAVLPELTRIIPVEHHFAGIENLLAAVDSLGLPGIIARRSSSPYVGGRSDEWLRIRSKDLATLKAVEPPNKSRRSKRVTFTNRRKVLWPRCGFTKGDLINYYDAMADIIVRHLSDRPLSVQRWPNGVDGNSFFQKHAPGHTPDWVKTARLKSSGGREQIDYILCSNRDTLLYLANLAAIELHPWLSRVGSVNTPDWGVIDLDPFGVDFRTVVQIAREIHAILDAADVQSFPKTSGSKGLHIYIPFNAVYEWDQVRMFCEGVCRLIVTRFPDIATVERVKSRRVGKVYLDFMQNRRGQTIVAPYAPRPVESAAVSTPLDWAEVDASLDPNAFHLQSVPRRVTERGDLFENLLDCPQDLAAAAVRVGELARESSP